MVTRMRGKTSNYTYEIEWWLEEFKECGCAEARNWWICSWVKGALGFELELDMPWLNL